MSVRWLRSDHENTKGSPTRALQRTAVGAVRSTVQVLQRRPCAPPSLSRRSLNLVVGRRTAEHTTMNETLANFRDGFIRTSVEFLALGGFLLLRLYRRNLFLRFWDWDSDFSRRLGLPARWIERSRRFSQGKGFIVILSILVLIFFLLMCGNLVAYFYFRHRLDN